jgi:hypothetical protein
MFAPTRTVTAVSDPLTLSVAETPGDASGWVLPAAHVELREVWQPDPPVFRVGEAVTRKVQVLALGAHGEQIPDLAMPDIPGARVYFEGSEARSVPTGQGTAAAREFTWSIVPTTGGTLTLPDLSVDWFDTSRETPATATSQVRVSRSKGRSWLPRLCKPRRRMPRAARPRRRGQKSGWPGL